MIPGMVNTVEKNPSDNCMRIVLLNCFIVCFLFLDCLLQSKRSSKRLVVVEYLCFDLQHCNQHYCKVVHMSLFLFLVLKWPPELSKMMVVVFSSLFHFAWRLIVDLFLNFSLTNFLFIFLSCG